MHNKFQSPKEETKELKRNAKMWNFRNPSFELTLEHWQEKLNEAKSEGYISEKCSCGAIFLSVSSLLYV